GINSRATKGQVTKTVTITMPGQENINCTSRSINQLPNQPLLPYSSRYSRPATTGDTAKGMSINVISALRPGKSKRVTSHASSTPKTRLMGTVSAATIKVSPIACKV